MKAKEINPKVTIGLPVYNGEKTIEKAIKSLLAQTFKDFELIISDNASDDKTQNICQRLALLDERIYYVRQSKNIGIYKNFNFLISIAKGKYFTWAAADDWRSPEFLEVNVFALDSNLKFVASTSPNCFELEENNPTNYIDFNLKGSPKERFAKFLQNAWQSHGIFYSLMRSEAIKKNTVLNFSYAGTDWSFNFFLLSKGKINRTKEGLLVLGRNGVSMSKNPWKVFRNKPIEFIIPLYEFSKCALGLMKNLKYFEWLYVFAKLLRLNLQAMKFSYIVKIREFIK